MAGNSRGLQYKWIASDYCPMACGICGRRPLSQLQAEIREQYIASPPVDQQGRRSYNSVWNDPRFELGSKCCRKELVDFEPLDQHVMYYERANSELPPDYSMPEYVQMKTTKTGDGREIGTAYHTIDDSFYSQ